MTSPCTPPRHKHSKPIEPCTRRDPHGRLGTQTDARNGTTTYSYYDDDQIHTITTPDPDGGGSGSPQVTEFTYDAAGRRDIVRLPDHTGGSPKEVNYDYYATGDLESVSGARTYSVDYTYTAQGRLETLETLATAGGTTTWNYFPETGLLRQKVFQDATNVDYAYTAGGRVNTRITERGITTTYGYNDAGQLGTITYSGGTPTTPNVTYGYNRLGQLGSVSRDGVSHVLDDNEFGQLLDETISGGIYAEDVVIDPSYDSLRRRNGLTVSVGSSSVVQSFSYDDASRLKSVGKGSTINY